MLNTVLTKIDRTIEDNGYDSFTMKQNIENISYDYEDIINEDKDVKINFLKEQFGTQFTDEQYDLIMRFGDEMYDRGVGNGFFDGIADERERQDW